MFTFANTTYLFVVKYYQYDNNKRENNKNKFTMVEDGCVNKSASLQWTRPCLEIRL